MARTTRTANPNNPNIGNAVAVPLPVAAQRLNIPADTIRRRLDRGRIDGFRAANGRVMVMMHGNDLMPVEPEQTRTTRTVRSEQPEQLLPPSPAPADGAVVALLKDEVADLRARLDRAEVAQGELRQLLLAAQRTIADLGERLALPAPGQAPGGASARAQDSVVVDIEADQPEPPARSMKDLLARFRGRTSH